MRPDKKGKRKPHPGQNSGGGRGTQSHTKTNSVRDGPRPAAVKPQPTPTSLGCAAGAAAAVQGPRVLPPAEPPAADQTAAKYHAREIRSNWARYEDTEDAEDELQPGEDYRRGDTFEDLLAAAGSGGGHFRLRSERGWLREGGGAELPALLTLDVDHLAGLLQRVPLHRRLDIDEKHFTDEELTNFRLEAGQGGTAVTSPADDAAPVSVALARIHQTQRQEVCQRTLDLLTAPDKSAEGTQDARTAEDVGTAEDVASAAGHVPSTVENGLMTTEMSPDLTAEATVKAAAVAGGELSAASATGDGVHNGSVSPAPAAGSASGDGTSEGKPPAAAGPRPAGISSDVTAVASNVAGGGTAALLDEDWLDSVLSDED